MSQKRTTTYTCDHCKKDVPVKRELRRFTLTQTTGTWDGVAFDVCGKCEAELLDYVRGFMPEGEDLDALRRAAK